LIGIGLLAIRTALFIVLSPSRRIERRRTLVAFACLAALFVVFKLQTESGDGGMSSHRPSTFQQL
jgi:uncharacterized membrane protein YqjE